MMQSFTKTQPNTQSNLGTTTVQTLEIEAMVKLMAEEFYLFIDGCFVMDEMKKLISPEQFAQFTAFLTTLAKFRGQDAQMIRTAARLLCNQHGVEVADHPPFAPLE